MSSATFLGLPPELRLQIYEHAILLDADFVYGPSQHLTKYDPLAERYCQNIQIPWLNLLHTCKAVAGELRSFMSSREYRTSQPNRTWEIDVRTSASYQPGITRMRLACKPRDVHAVLVTITLRCTRKVADKNIAMDLLNLARHHICEPLYMSGPTLQRIQRPNLVLHICKLTINIADDGSAGYDSSKLPDMAMYKACFNFWTKDKHFADEMTLNLFANNDDKLVSVGRLCYYDYALVEASGYQSRPIMCHSAMVAKWNAYKEQNSLE